MGDSFFPLESEWKQRFLSKKKKEKKKKNEKERKEKKKNVEIQDPGFNFLQKVWNSNLLNGRRTQFI